MQKHSLPPQGSSPSITPPSSETPQTPSKNYEENSPLEIVSQCRHRLILLSSFIIGDGKAGEDRVFTPVMVDALYYSLISIEDDLERAIDGMSSERGAK